MGFSLIRPRGALAYARLVAMRLTPLARRRLTLVAMCFSQGMIMVDITIVNVALPSIQRELHMSPGGLEWVISAYALSLATLIPIGGNLGDRFGRKRIFLVGLAVFIIGCAGCALSTTDIMLFGFRALQGVGGAVMSALTLSILSEAYPPERRAGAIGLWAAAAGIGFGSGPIIGGLLLSVFDWSAIFWVNVPIGVLGIVVAVIGVSESRDPVRRPLDFLGLVLCAGGLFGITLALVESSISGWSSKTVIISLILGILALVAFALWEHRVRHPMAPPILFRNRYFTGSCSVYLFSYATLTGVMFFATLLFQDVKDWSALRVGLSWLTMNIPFLVMAQLAGRLNRRWRPMTVIVVGLVVASAGIFGLSRLTVTTPFLYAAVGYALLGLGFGMMTPAVANAAMSQAPEGISGIASGILNAARQVGTSVGLAVLGTIEVGAAVNRWAHHVSSLPPSQQAAGRGLEQAVAGGQVSQVGHQLGPVALGPASGAFLHGYALAMGVAATGLLVAAGIALVTLRTGGHQAHPTLSEGRSRGREIAPEAQPSGDPVIG